MGHQRVPPMQIKWLCHTMADAKASWAQFILSVPGAPAESAVAAVLIHGIGKAPRLSGDSEIFQRNLLFEISISSLAYFLHKSKGQEALSIPEAPSTYCKMGESEHFYER